MMMRLEHMRLHCHTDEQFFFDAYEIQVGKYYSFIILCTEVA